MRFFARVDKIVGVVGSLGVHLPTEDVNLKIVEGLTVEYEFEQRTILYRDNTTRAGIEAIVKQRHKIMSRGASTNVRNVGQALIANKPGRRNRKQESSGRVTELVRAFSIMLLQPRTTTAAVRRTGSTTTCGTSVTDAWSQAIGGSTAPRTSSLPRRSRKTALVRL